MVIWVKTHSLDMSPQLIALCLTAFQRFKLSSQVDRIIRHGQTSDPPMATRLRGSPWKKPIPPTNLPGFFLVVKVGSEYFTTSRTMGFQKHTSTQKNQAPRNPGAKLRAVYTTIRLRVCFSSGQNTARKDFFPANPGASGELVPHGGRRSPLRGVEPGWPTDQLGGWRRVAACGEPGSRGGGLPRDGEDPVREFSEAESRKPRGFDWIDLIGLLGVKRSDILGFWTWIYASKTPKHNSVSADTCRSQEKLSLGAQNDRPQP